MYDEKCKHDLVTFCIRCWIEKHGELELFDEWSKCVCREAKEKLKQEEEDGYICEFI